MLNLVLNKSSLYLKGQRILVSLNLRMKISRYSCLNLILTRQQQSRTLMMKLPQILYWNLSRVPLGTLPIEISEFRRNNKDHHRQSCLTTFNLLVQGKNHLRSRLTDFLRQIEICLHTMKDQQKKTRLCLLKESSHLLVATNNLHLNKGT